MNFVDLYVAGRYLRSKRKLRFINVIGYISIVGITIGVAALLIALSVFNGFSGVVTSVLLGFDPHLRIEKKGNLSVEEFNAIENILKSNPEVKAYSTFVTGKALLNTKSFNKVVFLRGIDENKIASVSGLKSKIVLGTLDFSDIDGVQGIVIGLNLADQLSAVIGDELIVYSANSVKSAFSGVGLTLGTKFRVTGIYQSNNKEYDANFAYISLPMAQQMFELNGKFNGVEVRLQDFHKAEKVKSEIGIHLAPPFSIYTWYDLHKSLYSVMKIERWSAYILLTLIILVASFNLLGSMTMGVIEKQRDISILKAMGMNRKNLTRIFMFEGLLIGMIGTILGVIIGLIVLYLQVQYQIFPLDTTIYIIPAIPVEIHFFDFIAISVASLGLSCLASYYPAKRAALLLPIEGIRWE